MFEFGKVFGLVVFAAVVWLFMKWDERRCSARQTERQFRGVYEPNEQP